MNSSELLAAHLKHDLGMLKWHVDDFSESDMLVRPCPGANHASWQIGHIVSSTGRLLGMIDASFKSPVPAEVSDKYTKESSKSDNAKDFATLEQLRTSLTQLADAAHSWASKLPQNTLDAPSPDWAKDWCATNGLLLAGIASHVQMHIGQVQVIRRRLGKPNLF